MFLLLLKKFKIIKVDVTKVLSHLNASIVPSQTVIFIVRYTQSYNTNGLAFALKFGSLFKTQEHCSDLIVCRSLSAWVFTLR